MVKEQITDLLRNGTTAGSDPRPDKLAWDGVPIDVYSGRGLTIEHDHPRRFSAEPQHMFYIEGDKQRSRMVLRRNNDREIQILGAAPDVVVLEWENREPSAWAMGEVANGVITIDEPLIDLFSFFVDDASAWSFTGKAVRPKSLSILPALVLTVRLTDFAGEFINTNVPPDFDLHRGQGNVLSAYTYTGASPRPQVMVRDFRQP